MRVLGRVRISRVTDESTSAARQRELIQNWAATQEHQIVGWAEDLDVSGSVDPFDTPQLGDWLNNRADEFDIICSWKLDRIARRSIPMHRLFGWCQENDKTIYCISDSIDLSNWVGRLVASVIAGVAEGELEAIKERTAASHKKLRELGRWPGGKPAYGFRKVKTPEGIWKLEHDPDTAPVMRQIVADVLDGQSVESIAGQLTAPTPSGGARWRSQTIRKLLRSKTLLGHVTHDGATVRDTNGDPVLKGPPLITQDEFDRVQAALEGRSHTKTRTDKASPLLGLVKCMKCDGNMHHRGQTTGGKLYRYYYCRSCKGKQTKAEVLESLFEKTYLKKYGDQPRQELVYIPASSHQQEREEVLRAVDEATDLLGTMTSDTMKARLAERLSVLDARLAQLDQIPEQPARWEQRDTEQTHREAWGSAGPEERRQLLLKSGIVGFTAWTNGNLALVLTNP